MGKSLEQILREMKEKHHIQKQKELDDNQEYLNWVEHNKYLRNIYESSSNIILSSSSTSAGGGGNNFSVIIPTLPETIEELSPVIWYNADNVEIDGSDNVTRFNDLSGNDNYATPITGTLVYNQGTTSSQAENNYIQMTNAVAGATTSLDEYLETTVFVVYKSPTSNRQSIYGSAEAGDPNYNQMSLETLAGRIYLYSGNGPSGQSSGITVDVATSSIANTTNVYCGEHTMGTKAIILNGLYKVSNTISYNAFDVSWTPTIGSNNRKMDGEWYEMIVFDKVLSLEEKDVVFRNLGTKYGITMSLWGDIPNRVGLYGIMGQSNAGGRGDLSLDLPDKYDGTQSGVFISTAGQTNQPLIFDKAGDSANNGSIAGRFGVEASLGFEYNARTGNDMYIVKNGPGGTLLYDDNITNSVQSWHPRITTEPPILHLTATWLTRYYASLVDMQNSNIYPYRPTVMIWQGEQDAVTSTASVAYEDNGNLWVRAVARNLGYDRPYNYMDIELTRISVNNDLGDQPFLENVRTAQNNIAAANPKIVTLNNIDDNDKYTVFDAAHVDGAGLITYGIELQERYLEK